MFHPSKACQLAFCQQPKHLCTTGRKKHNFPSVSHFSTFSRLLCPAQWDNPTLSMIKYYIIFGAAPKYRDETHVEGLMQNHNLKLQQWHSSDFFTEVGAKCFNEQDENGHSRFDPVHFQMIQYESYFLQISSLNFVNMVFSLSAVKKKHPTPHTSIYSL